MINKDIFLYLCKEKGIDKTAALKLYKKAVYSKKHDNPQKNNSNENPRCQGCGEQKDKCICDKLPGSSKLKKQAFDLGFNDALRMFNLFNK